MYHMERHIISRLTDYSLSAILLTHHHEDHIGNAAKLQELYMVPVYAHRSALQLQNIIILFSAMVKKSYNHESSCRLKPL